MKLMASCHLLGPQAVLLGSTNIESGAIDSGANINFVWKIRHVSRPNRSRPNICEPKFSDRMTLKKKDELFYVLVS